MKIFDVKPGMLLVNKKNGASVFILAISKENKTISYLWKISDSFKFMEEHCYDNAYFEESYEMVE
jgi:hypothetical protein